MESATEGRLTRLELGQHCVIGGSEQPHLVSGTCVTPPFRKMPSSVIVIVQLKFFACTGSAGAKTAANAVTMADILDISDTQADWTCRWVPARRQATLEAAASPVIGDVGHADPFLLILSAVLRPHRCVTVAAPEAVV